MRDSRPIVNWRFAAACAVGLALAFTIQNYVASAIPISFFLILARQTVIWGVWLALTPLVIASARRNPFDERPRGKWVRKQLWIGAGFCVVHSVVAALIRVALGISMTNDIRDAIANAVIGNLGRNYLSYAIIAVSYQAVAYHAAVRQRDAEASSLQIDLAESKLANLEGRLRPHFLFNTLNTIAALVREDPHAAEKMIEQLSDLLRASLRTDPSREVRLDEELQLAEQYLAIQQVRFQDRLHVSLFATDEAKRGYVPHLILQPLVENAVRHGIAPRESGGSVWVRAEQPNGRLRIIIEDDGVGMGGAPSSQAGGGVGLGSVKSRLAHLYGAEQTVEIGPRTPTGTRVTIEIPYHSGPHDV